MFPFDFDAANAQGCLESPQKSFEIVSKIALKREKIEKSAERSVLAELRSNMGSWTTAGPVLNNKTTVDRLNSNNNNSRLDEQLNNVKDFGEH